MQKNPPDNTRRLRQQPKTEHQVQEPSTHFPLDLSPNISPHDLSSPATQSPASNTSDRTTNRNAYSRHPESLLPQWSHREYLAVVATAQCRQTMGHDDDRLDPFKPSMSWSWLPPRRRPARRSATASHVGQMGATVLHSRNLRVPGPAGVSSRHWTLLLARPVKAGQLGASRHHEAGGLGQRRQKTIADIRGPSAPRPPPSMRLARPDCEFRGASLQRVKVFFRYVVSSAQQSVLVGSTESRSRGRGLGPSAVRPGRRGYLRFRAFPGGSCTAGPRL